MNRLAKEVSPYLLQHANNPVDWFPWGDEAFKAAKEEDKPIFLSIGYATCHWCHVMEEECFDDPDIAAIMNDVFVNVKVDREEHPEIDTLYMDFAQTLLGGGGGWPLNLVLTPDGKPIFAATYLPAESHGSFHLSLRQLVERIGKLWRGGEREAIFDQAERVMEALQEQANPLPEDLPSREIVDSIADLHLKLADPVFGGLQGVPKFPMAYLLSFLLDWANQHKESRMLFYVHRTLEQMYCGGIFDHLGGGFARYSIDEAWIVPHFEKMLYDNAFLILSYLDAWKLSGIPLYRAIAEKTCDYLLREMRHPEGGFYSAQDADSQGKEGFFYTWTPREVASVLGEEDAELFCAFYGITMEGNFEGRSVLHIPRPLEEFARENDLDALALGEELDDQRQKLFEARKQNRAPLLTDDKIITSWNGLAIRALAEAGAAFGRTDYLEAANSAANFLRSHLWIDGRILHRWREAAGLNGFLEDYTHLISGLISLFEAGQGSDWIAWALKLAEVVETDFSGEAGYFRTDGFDPNLLLRRVDLYDGAEPSGNAIHAENLLRLQAITGASQFLEMSEIVMRAATSFLKMHPLGGSFHITAMQRYLDTDRPTLIFALDEAVDQEMYSSICRHYMPHASLIWLLPSDEKLKQMLKLEQTPVDGKSTLYLCRQGSCKEIISDPADIIKSISNL